MPPITLQPLRAAPHTTWCIPGSKSLTNRALVLAALARGTSILKGVLRSDDTRYMRAGLESMGASVVQDSETCWSVTGGQLHAPQATLFVGNSGTTVRFLTGLAALLDGETTLNGDIHMSRRPIADLVDALGALGIAVDCPTGCPPLTVQGHGTLPGGRITVPGDRSSQYFTALMMAGCAADAPLIIDIGGSLVSRPYVEMTAAIITDFGGAVQVGEHTISVTPAPLRAQTYIIEPDASAASYAFAAAAATGGTITVPGLHRQARQGDVAFVDVLEAMGARVSESAVGLCVSGGSLVGVDVDMKHISDTVMTLAAIAPLARGTTTIRNIANIRIKETDRLHATVTELRRMGQQVEEGDDWMRITPRPIQPAAIDCYGDHRMAMSFAIPGLVVPGITITDPACVSKTYPGFWTDLARMIRDSGDTPDWSVPS